MGIDMQIFKDFGEYKLDINLKSDGRHLAILGASGSGKSLTLKMLAGIIKPDYGKIVVDGKVLYDSDAKICLKPQKRRIGYLFQNYALFPTMTVKQNIAIGITDKKKQAQTVLYYIEKLGLKEVEDLYPKQLSGGQQQRVALARILASEPDMILLDESFSALDDYRREQTQREFQNYLREYKGIVIMVSHNREEIYQLSEEMIVIHEGKTVAYGNTIELFNQPQNLYAAQLTGCKNIKRIEVNKNICTVPEWDMQFRIPASDKRYTHIGIRAHHFLLDKPRNGAYYEFPVEDMTIEESIWEYTVCFKTTKKAISTIKWKIYKGQWKQENANHIKRLYLMEQDLMFLSEDS